MTSDVQAQKRSKHTACVTLLGTFSSRGTLLPPVIVTLKLDSKTYPDGKSAISTTIIFRKLKKLSKQHLKEKVPQNYRNVFINELIRAKALFSIRSIIIFTSLIIHKENLNDEMT